MKSHIQVLTTPTADTPGTTLLLHFDNKRYLIGSLAEGTQRACIQMGARLLKVSECFITGRTEWSNTGGLIGMILTLADAAASSAAASQDEAKRRVVAKARRMGVLEDVERMKELEEEARREGQAKLGFFAPPGVNHVLATARRFVFRKGMPIDVNEIVEARGNVEGDDAEGPYWADGNVKVWAFATLPESHGSVQQTNGSAPASGIENEVKMAGTVSPRKRSFEEVDDTETNGKIATSPSSLSQAERDELTVKAVVGEMFNSSWRLDTLHETPLGKVKMPASVFVRRDGKTVPYNGSVPGQAPKPGYPEADPDMIVLVRKPWPGALVESLPPTAPRKEAVSYIFKNHTQRGKFHPERAKALNVAKGQKWSRLSSGESVESEDGEIVTPEQVLDESKEGGGIAVIDIHGPEYLEPVLRRKEWRSEGVMRGVCAIVWILGPGVAGDERLMGFMEGMKEVEHVVSSPELCPNHIALDSAAAATVRLRQVDGKRYAISAHINEPSMSASSLPANARAAARGQIIQLEPKMEVHERVAVPYLNVPDIQISADVRAEAERCREVAKSAATSPQNQKWLSTLPAGASDAEIVTLGTGSALPSKYRNVSSTLLRVPGWGSMLFDAGENTLGQLKRVFEPEELKSVLQELRMIFISHMHADHHLGTVSVIKAWYEEIHASRPLVLSEGHQARESWNTKTGLAVVSEPAMLSWLTEYAQIEDFGFSRLAPLQISAALIQGREVVKPARLGWFIPPSVLRTAVGQEATNALRSSHAVPASRLNLSDIQAVSVSHCAGARAVSITFPSGFKASYSGDCRPSKAFEVIGKGSTVCIHEATFDDELIGDAVAKRHSTTSEALGVAEAMRSRSAVLTHFSQRYQKVPVLERGVEDEARAAEKDGEVTAAMEVEDSANPDDDMDAPLEDVMNSLPPETQDVINNEKKHFKPETTGSFANVSGAGEAVRFKLKSDMKVAVAFDYMRVKVGEIPELEHFTPALLKLFEEGDGGEEEGAGGGSDGEAEGGSAKKKGKKEKFGRGGAGGGKGRRNN
ncbi:hypothetical protein LTR78_001121 [Recurvomyces mirabilis]|uniref:ribonuclease Z n=1 Tax=Recurvomyces mirabilis TaxID=574656 RepID=A0AAE0WUZ9_9PEZI|nr:hypothetical protein LTR78_001121 [Recurvomyces mirabilis]KAK5161096.1 hypothetical protein LTS14_000892 [Recurvomyces mirabilis]